jgi:hypothetical protein
MLDGSDVWFRKDDEFRPEGETSLAILATSFFYHYGYVAPETPNAEVNIRTGELRSSDEPHDLLFRVLDPFESGEMA